MEIDKSGFYILIFAQKHYLYVAAVAKPKNQKIGVGDDYYNWG